MGRINKWRNSDAIRRRNSDSNFRNGRLADLPIQEVEKGKITRKVVGKVLIVTLPEGTDTENINLYRYIRLLAHRSFESVKDYLNIPMDNLPIEAIVKEAMKFSIEDVDYLIESQIISTMMDMELIDWGKKGSEE